MFRRVGDFEKSWAYEAEMTGKMLRALTDDSLAQRVTPDGRTLGRLAWHVTTTPAEMMGRTGLQLTGPAEGAPAPATVSEIVSGFERQAQSLASAVRHQWNDQTLEAEDDMYGERWTRGYTLYALILHQAHHRGQMTVLMRQAGLVVPGVYGPAREEWAQMGVPAME